MRRQSLYMGFYLVAVLGLIGGFVAYKSQTKPHTAAEDAAAAAQVTTGLVAQYQAELAKHPDDINLQLELAAAYLQYARESADVTVYNEIDALMAKAAAQEPDNAEVYATEAQVALARHQFVDGLALGQKAVAINPYKATYYGLIVDAQTELGKNDEAVNTLQIMVDTRPDFNSFSRIAYARELHGDIEGARDAIKTAIEAGAAFPENLAWGYVEIGKLEARTNLDTAKQQFELALVAVPDYAPALEQLGKLAYAQGDTFTALDFFTRAFEILPIAQYATDIADAYMKIGDSAKAEQYYALASLAFSQAAQGGVNTDMELALFLADRDQELPRALELAQASYLVRPSIYGADALAWTYFKNNRLDEAAQAINDALRLGEHDPHIVYHAAVIAEARGNLTEAKRLYTKALELHPAFSLTQADQAQLKLNSL